MIVIGLVIYVAYVALVLAWIFVDPSWLRRWRYRRRFALPAAKVVRR